MAAQDALDDAAWFGGELMKRDAENARLTALLAERDAEIKALVEALRQGIELGEAWERVDNPEAAGEWSMYLLPDFMEAARAALAGSREQAQGEGAR